jgi:hypothetical protein
MNYSAIRPGWAKISERAEMAGLIKQLDKRQKLQGAALR